MTSIIPLARRGKRNRAGKNIWAADRVVAARNASPVGGHYDKDRPAIIAWVSRQGAVVIQATKDFTVKTVQKAADLAVHTGSRLYTDSASSYRAFKGYVYDYINHTKKEYARGEVHENRAECLFSLLKPYLRVFRGLGKTNLPGYVGFFQFLRNFHQLTALYPPIRTTLRVIESFWRVDTLSSAKEETMRHSYRPDIPPKPRPYRTLVLDHLGLVAGMFEDLGITEVIDKATQQDPAMRIVTAGQAVKAMGLTGLGFINQQLYLVPHFFQNKPISRLMAPGIQASHRKADTLGRALDTLYETGVTALYSLLAATAARRLGLTPTCSHRDTTSFHVDGRSNSDAPPDEQVVHITPG